MNWLIDNWYIIIVTLCMCVAIGGAVYYYAKLPTAEQLTKVREWLIWACTKAEQELGGGTGQLKLRQVYDLFLVRFPWLAKIITFAAFSVLVDEALVTVREMLEENDAVKKLVEGGAE